MSENRKACIEEIISQKKDNIKNIDEYFFGDVIGVTQAIGQLKEALEKIDECLHQREFEKASSLGYSDVSSAFVFLQRCLGGLNDTVAQKDILVQDICIELSNKLKNIRNEEVMPLVTKKIDSLKPITIPIKIEVSLGKKTMGKLHSLQNIRRTPIEHLAELILASAMKSNETYWQKLENSKPSISNIKQEEKEWYSGEEVSDHMEALEKQEEERLKNLY